MSIYKYSVVGKDGKEISLEDFKGKVLMIVNTATGCGFTPQYKDIEDIYEKYRDKGFEVIDIPCNQFAGQAPESDDEITEFCTLRFGTKYLQVKKSDVNGETALPLYGYLKEKQGFEGFGDSEMSGLLDDMLGKIDPDYKNNPEIKWNFTKFIVDREGNVVKRFEPTVDMNEVNDFIEALL